MEMKAFSAAKTWSEKKGNVSFYFSPSKWQVQWYWDSAKALVNCVTAILV